jgi:hypothetical protein
MLWKERLESATAGRRELPLDELCSEFGIVRDVDASQLRDALSVFEQEYEIPVGKLRADDPLALFTNPPQGRGPISWLFNRASVEDKTSELNYELKKQRKRLRVPAVPSGPLVTVGDYVRAWTGRI